MDLNELSERPKSRALFATFVVLLIFLIWALRYSLLPSLEPKLNVGFWEATAIVLDDLASTIIVSLTLGLAVWVLTPKLARRSAIYILEPRDIPGAFVGAFGSTLEWRFLGGCGRFFRSEVLKRLEKAARDSNSHRVATAIILDPRRDDLCSRHARYRNATDRGVREGGWTKVRVKQELLVTIVVSVCAGQRCGLLDVTVLLVDFFTGFRLDISDSCVIQTREDKSAPAVKAPKESYYYSAFCDEWRFAKQQASHLSCNVDLPSDIEDVQTLTSVLAKIGIGTCGLSHEELKKILPMLKSPENPYPL